MFRGFATCFFVLMASFLAEACSCGGSPTAACQAAWRPATTAVFIGRVESITSSSDGNIVKLKLSESFRGVDGKSVEVLTPGNEAACGFSFGQGRDYLVYAESWKGKLIVYLCSATRPLKYVPADDLDYLRSIRSLPPTSWVYGTLKRYTFDPKFKPTFQPSIMDHYLPEEESYMALSPESGIRVSVAGHGKEWTSVVDRDGKWIVKDLTPGTYTVTARLPAGLVPADEKVSLAPKACAELDLRTQLDGHITGTILMPPRADDWVFLDVSAIRIEDQSDSMLRGPSDVGVRTTLLGKDQIYAPKAGPEPRFDVGPLPEGEYVLAIYLTREVKKPNSLRMRDAKATFFPGVDDIAHATRIKLGAGEKLSGYQIPLKHTEVEE